MLETRVYGDVHHEDRQRPSDGKGLRARLRHGAGDASRAPLWEPPARCKPRAVRGMSIEERKAHRAEQKRQRRNRRTPIVQCEACGACATGTAHSGRVVAVDNLPVSDPCERVKRHKGCGGVIRAYDITGNGAPAA